MHFFWMLFLIAPVFPQPVPPFRNLVTTHDGGRLYFISERPMRGTSQPWHDKVFVWTPEDGLALFASEPRVNEAPEPFYSTNYYKTFHISISADGSRYATAAIREWRMSCFPCGSPYRASRSRLTGVAATPIEQRGVMHLSANGRHALLLPKFGDAPPASGILESDTATFTPLPFETLPGGLSSRCPCGGRRIANNGTYAHFRQPNDLVVAKANGVITSIRKDTFRDIVPPMLDDEATMLVFQAFSPPEMVVHPLNGAAPVHVPLATPAGISADGSAVLFLRGAQIHLMDSDGGNERRLTSEPSGVVDAALSGDGKIVYYTTAAGSIFRLQTDSGDAEPVLSAPVRLSLPENVARGSLYRVLPQVTQIPEGLALRIAGRSVPLYETPSGVGRELWAHIPADLPEGPASVEWDVPVSLFFDPQIDTTRVNVRRTVPAFATGPTACLWNLPSILAVHDRFDSLVTHDSPARSGERIHLLMTGLPEPAVSPLSCVIEGRNVDILSSVPAPGMLGLHQVTLRLPDPLTNQTIACTVQGQLLFGVIPVERNRPRCVASIPDIKW